MSNLFYYRRTSEHNPSSKSIRTHFQKSENKKKQKENRDPTIIWKSNPCKVENSQNCKQVRKEDPFEWKKWSVKEQKKRSYSSKNKISIKPIKLSKRSIIKEQAKINNETIKLEKINKKLRLKRENQELVTIFQKQNTKKVQTYFNSIEDEINQWAQR